MSAKQKLVRVVIADDHAPFRIGVRRILEGEPDLAVVGEAADGAHAVHLVAKVRPEILLLDVFMPRLNGIEVLQRLAADSASVQTILITMGIDRTRIIEALHLGARGLIIKDADLSTYAKAIRCVHRGELWIAREVLTDWAFSNGGKARKFGLTAREFDIIREISRGSSNKQIAAKLAISEVTVKSHLTNIYEKLGVTSRLELSIFALHHHLLA